MKKISTYLFKLGRCVSNILFGNILRAVSFLVPKNKNIWIFGSWFGEKYIDNSKYFFEYINEKHLNVRAVWLTRSKKVLKFIRNRGYEAYLTYSIKGCWFSIRSGVAIIAQVLRTDLNHYALSNGTKIIQLWHGIPLKKIMYDSKRNCPSGGDKE